MKKIFLILIALGLFSCESVLDKGTLQKIDSDKVWNSAALSNLYLNELYESCLPGFAGNSNTDISDESNGSGADDMMYGGLSTSSAYGNFSAAYYNVIRKINILIENIDEGSLADDEKNPIKAQALFLRAWRYWNLVIYYGGVPYITEVQDLMGGDELYVERDPASVCVNGIVQDLDQAMLYLPTTVDDSERGRIVRAAAAALKGRVLLFYASPQFNPDNLQERWQTAYDANVEAKNECDEAGFSLYRNYEDIFLAEDNANEAIFMTIYDGVIKTHGYENSVRPASEKNENSSSGCPTWQLVSAYPMADGFAPGQSPNYTYDENYFWQNRDPRFYATIAYNGCEWPLSGQNGRKQWNYIGSVSEERAATETGFYCRRNIDDAVISTETPRSGTDWIEIRYAEVLLNLAECAAELDLLSEAEAELMAIRERAGVENTNGKYGITASTSDEMVEAVMLERQIEFAYENKRHWDLRRRNLYAEKINGTRRTGIITTVVFPDSIYKIVPPADTINYGQCENDYLIHFYNSVVDTIDIESDYYTYFNTGFDWELDGADINFEQPKYNFYFIPQSALDKNPNLQQTINWGIADPFDPLTN